MNGVYLNLKNFIQGAFGKHYRKSKDLVKKETGNIFCRQPNNYNDTFNLDFDVNYIQRRVLVKELFENFILPYGDRNLTK